MLNKIADPPITVLIVWEPVVWTDLSAPTTSVMSLVFDTRAAQFWDEHRSLSEFMVRSAIDDPSLMAPGESIYPDTIVWDFIAIFPPGAIWDSLPRPVYYGGPVVDVLDEVQSRLTAPAP